MIKKTKPKKKPQNIQKEWEIFDSVVIFSPQQYCFSFLFPRCCHSEFVALCGTIATRGKDLKLELELNIQEEY